ncbi:hypothetical protein [uncultured Desulfosarcina sp.]|uniref:hypothetical protein n=1 Tax=uncultured Desulfosarcina sp. TaxID=218289 RepID=UPI0029C8260C|nr:hypothetical protein [uncultured Desulfosarcina sp.]
MQSHLRIRFLIAAVLILPAAFESVGLAQDYGISLYAGQLTEEKWEDAILPDADFTDATIVVASGSWTPFRFFEDKLSCELEAQIGKYFGDQDHWEFNLPIIALRWHRFPWNRYLANTIAWGIGPSYATEVPSVELETNDDSSRWLIYWYGELTFAPPVSSWELMLRLHHRSDGFGTVAEDGGSNAVCAGLRYRF